MLTSLLFFLLLLSFGFSWFGWRKTAIAFLTVTMVLFILIGCGPVPAWLVSRLQTSHLPETASYWGKNNAILLLGAGTVKLENTVQPNVTAYARITKALQLYLACKKTADQCHLVLSGGDVFAVGKSEALVYRDILLTLGVEKMDIILEPDSKNTFENAKFIKASLKGIYYDNLVMVTSALHMQRALLCFASFDIYPQTQPADYTAVKMSLLPRGYNFAVADAAIHEYLGFFRCS